MKNFTDLKQRKHFMIYIGCVLHNFVDFGLQTKTQPI